MFPGATIHTISVTGLIDETIETVDVMFGDELLGTIAIADYEGTGDITIIDGTPTVTFVAKDADGKEVGAISKPVPVLLD